MEHAQENSLRNFNSIIYDNKMIKGLSYTTNENAIILKQYCNETTFETPGADDYSLYKDFILEKASFVKILKKIKLKPEECHTGSFTHRMVCPFKFHKNGRERTSSFRFNEKTKSFFCFGCLSSGTILTFLQFYVGGGENYHLEKISEMLGLVKDGKLDIPKEYIDIEPVPPVETNHKILFNIGILLRQYLLDIKAHAQYNKECEWADKTLIKIDQNFSIIGEENIEDAQKIFNKIEAVIKKRQQKIQDI